MSMNCSYCGGTGFLNIEQVDIPTLGLFGVTGDVQLILDWIKDPSTQPHDVEVCDCCGDGKTWYGEPGRHYGRNDPRGKSGPYAYNGGLCECS